MIYYKIKLPTIQAVECLAVKTYKRIADWLYKRIAVQSTNKLTNSINVESTILTVGSIYAQLTILPED